MWGLRRPSRLSPGYRNPPRSVRESGLMQGMMPHHAAHAAEGRLRLRGQSFYPLLQSDVAGKSRANWSLVWQFTMAGVGQGQARAHVTRHARSRRGDVHPPPAPSQRYGNNRRCRDCVVPREEGAARAKQGTGSGISVAQRGQGAVAGPARGIIALSRYHPPAPDPSSGFWGSGRTPCCSSRVLPPPAGGPGPPAPLRESWAPSSAVLSPRAGRC